MQPEPVTQSRAGTFQLSLGQIKPALGDLWRSKWLLLKLAFVVLVVSAVLEVAAVVVSPEASLSDFGELLKVKADSAVPERVVGDDTVDVNPMNRTIEEAPVLSVLRAVAQLLIGFVSYIVLIFVAAMVARQRRVPSLAECWQALRSCPMRFYIASSLKWIWMIAPALAGAVVMAVTAGLGLLGMVVGGLCLLAGLVVSATRLMRYYFIELYSLFEGMDFGAAKAASAQLMQGRALGVFLCSLVLAVVVGLGGIVAAVLLMIPPVLLGVLVAVALPDAVAAIGVGVVMGWFAAALQLAGMMIALSWIYRLWLALRG